MGLETLQQVGMVLDITNAGGGANCKGDGGGGGGGGCGGRWLFRNKNETDRS